MANVKVGVNSSSFNKEMKAMIQQMKMMSGEMGVAATKAKLFGKSSDELKVKQKELTERLKIQNNMLKLQEDEIAKLNKGLIEEKKNRDNLKKSIDDTKNKIKESTAETGKNSQATKDLKAKLEELESKYKSSTNSINKMDSQLNNTTIKFNNTSKAVLQSSKELENLNNKLKNLKLDNVAQNMDKVSQKTGALADKLAPMATAVGAIGTAATTTSILMEDGLAKISTIADTSSVSIGDLKEGIIDLSNKTGVSTSDLNDAMYEALSASVDTADAIDFLNTSVKASKGGFTDTKTAVDGLTTVLNSYGLKASEVDKIANQMLITQNLGKTTFGELAQSLGDVTPVASSLGITTEELFSSLSATTSQGLQTSKSVTALKAAMSNIIKPTKEASDAASALGIDFSASALQSKGWIGFLEDVKKGLQNASPEFAELSTQFETNSKRMLELEQAGKKTSTEYKALKKENSNLNKEMELLAQASDSTIGGFATMFGSVEGLNSILMLTSDQGIDMYNKSMGQMQTNTTALDDAFNKMNNTTGAELKKSFQQAKNSLIGFGDIIAPVISSVASGIGWVSEKIGGLSEGTKQFVVATGGLLVGATVTLKAVSGITGTIRDGIDAFKDFKDIAKVCGEGIKTFGKFALDSAKSVGNFVLNLGKSTVALAKNAVQMGISAVKMVAHKVATIASTIATNAMSMAQAALNFIMALNPITLVIIAIGALIAAIVLLWNKSETFRNFITGMWEGIKNLFISFKNFLVNAFTVDWTNSFGVFGNVINAFFANVKNMFDAVKRIFTGIIDFVAGVFTGDWSRAWEGVKNIFGGIMDGLGAVIKAPLNAVIGLINMALEQLNKISFTAPDWIPFVGGKNFSVNLPKINYLWKGGIIDQPTMLNANTVVGDNYNGFGSQAEAVVPLDSMYRNIDSIVNKNIKTNEQPIYVIVNVENELNGKKLTDVVTSEVEKKISRKQNIRSTGKGKLGYV